ncbi:hypothetical protein X751_29650 [Mesorhizobium sp. LNJC395A00]|nr:hypothetical protein X751_29650 [Mesorhizobium sp. LNJC395A00]
MPHSIKVFKTLVSACGPQILFGRLRPRSRIKGSHNAALSGAMAADRIAAALAVGRANDEVIKIEA